MADIKTREKSRGVKALDKAALAGERMKNATIRTKERAEQEVSSNGQDEQSQPSTYAGEQFNATAIAAVTGGKNLTKSAITNGKARIKDRLSHVRQADEPTISEDGIFPERTTAQRQQSAVKSVTQRQNPNPIKTRHSIQAETEGIKLPSPVERGREYAKSQAKERHRQEVRQIPQHPLSPHSAGQPTTPTANPSRIRHPASRAIKQKSQEIVNAPRRSGKAVKNSQRAVKTAQRTAKTTVKTAQATEKAAQKTAQASAKTARATAHAAKVAAKEAVVIAKAVAKALASAVKAIIAAFQELIAAIAAGGWVAVVVIVVICLIGLIVGSCFGIFFSGEDSGTGQTMPMAVREINQDYEARLDEIKAANPHDILEMSGSRAVWPEVLSIYAVKTTTDPNNAQDVASMDDGKKQLLKEIFWEMNEISHHTETHTVTEITETDDGEGNIIEEESEVTKTTLYIVVSHKTAEEMAVKYGFSPDQREQLAELLADENRELWSAVLYGIGNGDDAIVIVALSQIGNVGGQPYWSWYGFGGRVEWCACFVSWCADQCGYLDAGVIPKFSGCEGGSQWFKDRGLWQDRNYEPRPGDIIFFDWHDPETGLQDGSPDHVGIIEKVEGNTVYTVEGNSGNACRENTYTIGYFEIYGYGTPAY